MPTPRRQHTPPARDLLTIAERRQPPVTRREYGAIGCAALVRAGMPPADVATVRRHLESLWAADEDTAIGD